MTQPLSAPHGILARFRADSGGNVLMLTGLAILLLIGAAGAGIDLGRQQLVRLRLQQATDAAALAAATMPSGSSDQAKQDAALRVYNMNYPATYLGASRPLPTVSVGSSISVTATVPALPMYFMRVVGIDTREAQAVTRVSQEESSSSQPYDIILVMDNSGSMQSTDAGNGQSRLNALRITAQKLADKVLTKGDGSQIATQPWAQNPRDGRPFNSSLAYVTANLNAMYATGSTDSSYAMRTVLNNYVPYFSTDHIRVVILLTDGMNTSYFDPVTNSTMPPYKYAGPLKKSCTVADYAAKKCLCDGDHSCPDSDKATSNPVAPLGICQQIKNMKPSVLVYTIAFGSDVYNNAAVRKMLSECATQSPDGDNTDEYFFPAANSTQLDKAFDNIFTQIGKLRITD